jgi:hypothetical protein
MLRFLRGATHHTKTIWWVLIFLTVGSFLLGFVFLLGSGLGNSRGDRRAGVIGVVNGQRIMVDEYQTAINNQRETYKQQYGVEPADRDERMVEVQAWRGLVMEKLMNDEAKRLGIPAYDKEVVLTLESSPPSQLASQPVFQTNGKFDPSKYQQALRDPKNNWGPFEEMTAPAAPGEEAPGAPHVLDQALAARADGPVPRSLRQGERHDRAGSGRARQHDPGADRGRHRSRLPAAQGTLHVR